MTLHHNILLSRAHETVPLALWSAGCSSHNVQLGECRTHTGSFWVNAAPGDDAGYVAVEGGQAPRRGEDGEAEAGKLE